MRASAGPETEEAPEAPIPFRQGFSLPGILLLSTDRPNPSPLAPIGEGFAACEIIPMPLPAKRPETAATVLRPDFEGNARRRYLKGYSLLIASLQGCRLTPDQHDAAERASYTSQRLLNAALARQGAGETAWVP